LRWESQFQRFWTAVAFLTRLPVPNRWQTTESTDFRQLPDYFWLAGILIGGVQGTLAVLFVYLLPLPIAILLTLAFMVMSTGAFHEDGWADVADSFGGYSKERKLEIMKDSRLGTFGVSALILLFLLRFTALSQLANTGTVQLFWVLLLVNAWSRWSSVQLLRFLPYLSTTSKGIAGEFDPPSLRMSVLGFAVLILASGLSLQSGWFITMPTATVLSVFLGYLFYKNYLGGINGDCLGSVTILSELFILIALCAGA